MDHFKLYSQIAFSRSVVIRALKVALIIGTIINLINQGNILISFDFSNLNLIKIFLTYIVPYGVTTYTAISMKLEFHIGTRVVSDVNLKCIVCKEKISLKEGQIIPECINCGINTHWKLA